MGYEETYRRSIEQPEEFWAMEARQSIGTCRPGKYSTIPTPHSASGLSAARPIFATTQWTSILPTQVGNAEVPVEWLESWMK